MSDNLKRKLKEKIFGKKVLSDDSPPPKKTRKKSKARKSNNKAGPLCTTCWQDILKNEMRDMLMYKDTYHQLQVKEYCKEHTTIHSDHKCKPVWCGDCGYLTKYEITIDHSKWEI